MHSSSPDPTHSKRSTETRKRDIRLLSHQSSCWLPLARLWLCLAIVFTAIAFVVERAAAQVPVPGLTVGLSGTNLLIVVTNGVAGGQYELQRVNDLNDLDIPNFYWPTEAVGALGQTNFVIDMGIFYSGFFRIVGCIDCDGDGVPNYQDAQPGSTNAGILTITIDSPTNGSNIQ